MAIRNLHLEADQRIKLRIGINLDDVIIEPRRDIDAVAIDVGVIVRAVRDRVSDKLGFGFEDMGHRQVKNINRPVHIFRVFLDSDLGGLLRSQNADTGPAPRPKRGTRPKVVVAGAVAAAAALGALAAVCSRAGGLNAGPEPNPSSVIGGAGVVRQGPGGLDPIGRRNPRRAG